MCPTAFSSSANGSKVSTLRNSARIILPWRSFLAFARFWQPKASNSGQRTWVPRHKFFMIHFYCAIIFQNNNNETISEGSYSFQRKWFMLHHRITSLSLMFDVEEPVISFCFIVLLWRNSGLYYVSITWIHNAVNAAFGCSHYFFSLWNHET